MPDYSFSKCSRLLKPAEFQAVFNDAVREANRAFTVLAHFNQHGYPRLGLAISKKIAKTAIRRNLIKRIIRESFRQQQPMLISADFIVLTRQGVTELDRTQLRSYIDQLWQRFINTA